MKAMRLDRLLANLGYGSRREIQEMADGGLIVLDGSLVADAGKRVPLDPELPRRLRIGAQDLDPLPGVVILMHKPLGAVCSHKEAGHLVYDLLPQRWRRREPAISTIGRLDKDTSGLLLLTDDGALLHRVISPKAKIEKRYQVGLARPLNGDEESVFSSGKLLLDGEEKPLLPAKLEVRGERTCAVTITEGRYHQVRRMFAAVGNHVETLHRDRVGGLELPEKLNPGEWTLLDDRSQSQLFS